VAKIRLRRTEKWWNLSSLARENGNIGSTTLGGVVVMFKSKPRTLVRGYIFVGKFIRRFPGSAAAPARRNKAAEFIPQADSVTTSLKKYYLLRNHKIRKTTNQITSII
jgi:hypothetical protein